MPIVIKKKQTIAPEPAPIVAEKPRKLLVIRSKSGAKPAEAPAAPQKVVKQQPMDNLCNAALSVGDDGIVSWFMMASYAYYIHDMSIITDELYDGLAKTLQKKYGVIEHQHKALITPEHLEAGSLYDLPANEYPLMVRHATAHLIKHGWGVTIDTKPK